MFYSSVSVIMPVYNTPGSVLKEAIRSVTSQHGWSSRDTLVLVDDASDAEDTLQVIEEMTCEHASLVLYTHDERKGQAVARNAGVRVTNSEYVAFLDSDDFWFRSSLMARLLACTNTTGKPTYNFVSTSFIHRSVSRSLSEVRPPGPLVRDLCNIQRPHPQSRLDALGRLRNQNITIPMTVLMTRDLFNMAGGFPGGLVCGEDHVLWRRVMELEECNPTWIEEPAGYYNTFDVTLRLNQSRQLRMPVTGGFHLNVDHPEGHAGEYLDTRKEHSSRKSA